MRLASTWSLVALAALGCSPSRTEVLLVIDTDMRVPDELDEVRVDLIGPSGETRRSEGSITSPSDLPRTLALVDHTHTARTVRLTVTGLRRGANVVQRRAVFAFVPHETRILRVDLLRDCVGVSCPSDRTCAESGCRSIEIAPGELAPYDPASVSRMDGGMPDGSSDGGCVPADELCNGLDDDCDGEIDEDFALATDRLHCGSCGNACALAPENAASVCESGGCVLRCDPGYGDCNGSPEDGCEADLSRPDTCGRCDVRCGAAARFCQEKLGGPECVEACSDGTADCGGSCVDTSSDPRHCGVCSMRCVAPPNAVAACMGGACGFECDAGHADCDGRADNGCESTLRELDHCGRCGQRCARPGAITSCVTGTCQMLGCEGLRGDCDMDAANGCEEDLSTDPARCGACDAACPSGVANATIACAAGACQLTCFSGFGNCDALLSTGCEQSLAASASCGSCGVACTGATPLCQAVAGGGYACTSGCTASVPCGESCVDTESDPLHCGACGRSCPTGANAVATCTAGTCGLSCAEGFADCDIDAASCESSLASVATCGDCTNTCPPRPNAIATCSAGACGYRCQPGFEDCNRMPLDGCEVDTTSDLASCGSCGNRCTAGSSVSEVDCLAGRCTIVSCTAPNEDCDGSFANGCEVNLAVNRSHCGACGMACESGRRCCDAMCRLPSTCA